MTEGARGRRGSGTAPPRTATRHHATTAFAAAAVHPSPHQPLTNAWHSSAPPTMDAAAAVPLSPPPHRTATAPAKSPPAVVTLLAPMSPPPRATRGTGGSLPRDPRHPTRHPRARADTKPVPPWRHQPAAAASGATAPEQELEVAAGLTCKRPPTLPGLAPKSAAAKTISEAVPLRPLPRMMPGMGALPLPGLASKSKSSAPPPHQPSAAVHPSPPPEGLGTSPGGKYVPGGWESDGGTFYPAGSGRKRARKHGRGSRMQRGRGRGK